jgi:protein MPE1
MARNLTSTFTIKIRTKVGADLTYDSLIYVTNIQLEYKDDTTIIPRSTSIIAKRTPAQKSGRGTAQRYVNGKMPTNALPNAGRREKNFGAAAQPVKKAEPEVAPARTAAPAPAGGETEDDMINAMFQAQSEAWNKTQEQLAK